MFNFITYEHPVTERIRLFLRFEYFYQQAMHFQSSDTPWESHACLSAILELLMLVERQDVRAEISKEFDRHISILSRLAASPQPELDNKRLYYVLEQLQSASINMYKPNVKFNPILRENELLQTIRQRTPLSGSASALDIPAYHFWLNIDSVQKITQLTQWLGVFEELYQGIHLLLCLTRESAEFSPQIAPKGTFLKPLETQHPISLIRLKLNIEYGSYPEFSAGKHRMSVRFLQGREQGRSIAADRDIEFELSCCAI